MNSEMSGKQQTTNSKSESLELNHWNKKAALYRLMNNEVLLIRVSKMFLDSSHIKLASLSQSIQNRDFKTTTSASYSLKGACGDLGATKLDQHLSELIVLIANERHPFEEIQSKLFEIKKDYQVLLTILQKYTS